MQKLLMITEKLHQARKITISTHYDCFLVASILDGGGVQHELCIHVTLNHLLPTPPNFCGRFKYQAIARLFKPLI